MKPHDWDERKNETLIRERGISFGEILLAIEGNGLLDIADHPNPAKYPEQKIYVVRLGDYIYLVPFEETGARIHIITIIPSRKATRKYMRRGRHHEG